MSNNWTQCPARFAPFPEHPELFVQCDAFMGHSMLGHDHRRFDREVGFQYAISWYDTCNGALVDRSGKVIKR